MSRAYFRPPGPAGAQALSLAALGSAIAVTIVVELTGPLWSRAFEDVGYSGALRVAAIAGIPLTALIAVQQILRAQDRAGLYVFTAAIATAGGQLAGLLGASIDDANGYMLGVLAGTSVAAAIGLAATGLRLWPLRDRAFVRENFAIGLPTIPHSIAMYLLAAGDRVVVERLQGLVALGAYTISYTVGWLAVILAIGVNNAWAPTVYGASDEQRWTVLAETTSAVMRLMVLVAGGLALAAPVALDLAAPPSYALDGLGNVSALTAASVIPFTWYLANVNTIFWTGKTRVLAWASPLTAASNIGLNFLLVPPLGLAGAALATLLSYVLLAALIWRRARQLAAVPWEAGRLTAMLGFAVATISVALVMPEHGWWIVPRLAAAAVMAMIVVVSIAKSGRTGRMA